LSDLKKIVFLTGTRADFGKIKPLISILQDHEVFEAHIFVTGMHLIETYGYTLIEVEKSRFKNISTFENHTDEATMDLTLAKTIEGFSCYVKKINPDLIVIHGDRVEALSGAIVGSLNNILVAHIEGGEISGTVDELIRHATSKMSHIHFVANELARERLLQMGELSNSIFTIGSPDIDIMFSHSLPNLDVVKRHYQITFEDYAIAMFHPVTTEVQHMKSYAKCFVKALLQSKKNYVVVYPNNDFGSKDILNAYKDLSGNSCFRIFPSLRFEYFLTLLKHARFIVGNSSSGIREAPYYGTPSINIGTRQANRSHYKGIVNVDYKFDNIISALNSVVIPKQINNQFEFGIGNSAVQFLQCLNHSDIWELDNQKQFVDYIHAKNIKK
jgi:UDP-N-acetylglucosamine 2-epimerase (hydrolysing)